MANPRSALQMQTLNEKLDKIKRIFERIITPARALGHLCTWLISYTIVNPTKQPDVINKLLSVAKISDESQIIHQLIAECANADFISFLISKYENDGDQFLLSVKADDQENFLISCNNHGLSSCLQNRISLDSSNVKLEEILDFSYVMEDTFIVDAKKIVDSAVVMENNFVDPDTNFQSLRSRARRVLPPVQISEAEMAQARARLFSGSLNATNNPASNVICIANPEYKSP